MEVKFAVSLWLDGSLLGGTFFMWLMLQAAMNNNNATSRVLATLFCALIFLAGFSFFYLIGIG